ncbi:MAG: hypothetical protein M3304_05645 [Actinomycetota bacterium]|nr:hypothetical protein [Actinomycetota bacterium]
MAATLIDKPLALGEVLATTVRLYGERVWRALGTGAVVAGTFRLALELPDLPAIVLVAAAFTACYAASARVAADDGFAAAWRRVASQAPVLLVLVVVVAVPFALGVFIRAGDPLAGLVFLLFAVSWLVVVGFSIPITMLPDEEERRRWFERLGHGLHRSVELARTEFVHAVGVTSALVLIYGLLGPLLASVLVGFGDNGRRAAFLVSQVVLAPFFFLGLVVLYHDQLARERVRREPAPTASRRR